MARHIEEILRDLEQYADEPETVQSLTFEIRVALGGDIQAMLLMLSQACQRGNPAEVGMVLGEVDKIISPHITGFDPTQRHVNETRWSNVREVLSLSVQAGKIDPTIIEYVDMLAQMVRTQWKMEEPRYCLVKTISCTACGYKFQDTKVPGYCDTCGTVRRLCRNKAELGLPVCSKHNNALTSKRNGVYKHPTSILYGFKGQRFRELFDAAMQSNEMLSNADNIALFMARMTQMVELWEEAGGEDVIYSMKRIRTLKVALEMALEEGDEDRITRLGQAIFRAVDIIDSDRRYWEDMRNTTELLRRLRDSERQRILQAHNTLTLEEAMSMMEVLVGLLIEGIDQYVGDKRSREGLLTYMNRVLIAQNSNRAMPSLP